MAPPSSSTVKLTLTMRDSRTRARSARAEDEVAVPLRGIYHDRVRLETQKQPRFCKNVFIVTLADSRRVARVCRVGKSNAAIVSHLRTYTGENDCAD